MKDKKIKINTKEIGLLVFLIISVIFIQFKNNDFLSLNNILNLLKNTSLLAILSLGMSTVMISGGIDLSAGSVLALSGMSSAVLVSKMPNLPIIAPILLGVLVGVLSGTVLGLLVSKGKMIPTIASLAMMNVFRGLTYIVGNNKWISAHQMTSSFKNLSTGSFLGLNNLIWIAIICLIIFYYFWNYTKLGRHIYAVGSNPEATYITGINKDKTLLLAYMINGLLVGLVGVLWVSRYASAQGDTAMGYEMNIIAASVLGGISVAGGVGKISGLILGFSLLGILNNALPLLNVSIFWEEAITGFITLFAVIMNIVIQRRNKKKSIERRKI